MVNTAKKTFEQTSNDMKRLMGFSFFAEEDKKNYTSEIIEFKKTAADGKCYGIVREGNNKHYIKVSENTENPTKEDFNYIGGITEKARYCYETYQGALKNIEFKLREIKESVDKGNSIVELMNASKKQEIINENVVEMSKEIARQREIMFKTSGIIKEDLGYKPVLKITSTDADKKAEPFTEKVPEPKGDENPSKGNTTPESADKPYDTEVKPDMKADPSKAGKKFKITGLQLKAVKAKLKEGLENEMVNEIDDFESISKPYSSELSTLKRSNFVGPMRSIGSTLKNMILNMPEFSNPIDEYEYADKMLDIIGSYRTSNKMNGDLEALYDDIYTKLDRNEYYQEITADPDKANMDGDIDLDNDLDVDSYYKPDSDFDSNYDDLDVSNTHVFDESVEGEPEFEIDEEQLVEAILDVFGKVETFGKEPFSLPGGGTRQYAVQKPKAWGTEVTSPESEVTEEPSDANKELKPKSDVIDKSVYIKGLAESIANEIKKKV